MLTLQHPRGEILGSRMRFLLLPVHRNRQNFSKKGGGQCNAHSVCIFHKYSPCCTPRGIYDSVGYLFLSSSFCMVFADTRCTMSATSLYAFLVSIIKHIINADFERLIGKLIISAYEKGEIYFVSNGCIVDTGRLWQ